MDEKLLVQYWYDCLQDIEHLLYVEQFQWNLLNINVEVKIEARERWHGESEENQE